MRSFLLILCLFHFTIGVNTTAHAKYLPPHVRSTDGSMHCQRYTGGEQDIRIKLSQMRKKIYENRWTLKGVYRKQIDFDALMFFHETDNNWTYMMIWSNGTLCVIRKPWTAKVIKEQET